MMDVVHGEMEYSSAQSVRELACGPQGTLYQPEPQKYLKRAKHLLRKQWRVFGYLLKIIICLLLRAKTI